MFNPPWVRWRQRHIWRDHRIDDVLWRRVVDSLALFDRLTPRQLRRLHERASLFIHDKELDPVQGARIDERFKVSVAAQACLPILQLGVGWYRHWSSIIVYPDKFVAPHHAIDTSGVHHEWEEALSGQAWERGPVVLSMADVEASGHGDGFNVVIHEMAHKLDMLADGPNGCPPLHRNMDRAAWHRELGAAYEDLNRCLDRGMSTSLDGYAATSPGEFFAVCSETFFERPYELRPAYPGVYQQLARFYRQDPLDTDVVASGNTTA
jgi:Mlc titration factor MtfA (ptsG expression regulator)